MSDGEGASAATAVKNTDGYEFSETENVVLARVARSMSGAAITLLIAAGVTLLDGVMLFMHPADDRQALGAIVFLVFAVAQSALAGFAAMRLSGARRGVQAVVDTKGNDIPNMMAAVEDLRKLFAVLAFIVALAFVVVLKFVVPGLLIHGLHIG
jgi:hypothetical protein